MSSSAELLYCTGRCTLPIECAPRMPEHKNASHRWPTHSDYRFGMARSRLAPNAEEGRGTRKWVLARAPACRG
jgi:hypothetical protein